MLTFLGSETVESELVYVSAFDESRHHNIAVISRPTHKSILQDYSLFEQRKGKKVGEIFYLHMK